jgi:hypothetical protein
VPGAEYVEVSIIVSTDNGATYFEIPDDRLIGSPVSVVMEGLQPPQDRAVTVFSHPTTVASDAETGLEILVDEDGEWATDAVASQNLSGSRLTAELESLSIIAPFLSGDEQARISVTPAQLQFGTVEIGGTTELSFTVRNSGSGTMVGTARTDAPFAIVSGGNYSLGAGESQTVVVSFSPTGAEDYIEDVVFTGGGGATRPVFGTGAQIIKRVRYFGCGGDSGSAPGAAGDLAVLLATAGLLGAWRLRKRAHSLNG